MLTTIDTPMPQCTAGHETWAAGLPQIREADGDDEKRFESFAQRDDKCL